LSPRLGITASAPRSSGHLGRPVAPPARCLRARGAVLALVRRGDDVLRDPRVVGETPRSPVRVIPVIPVWCWLTGPGGAEFTARAGRLRELCRPSCSAAINMGGRLDLQSGCAVVATPGVNPCFGPVDGGPGRPGGPAAVRVGAPIPGPLSVDLLGLSQMWGDLLGLSQMWGDRP
jgi:hypothetical protein